MRRRSSATLNSTGVWNVAATVWPGSISRAMTMPSIGERIAAFARAVCASLTCACAEVTCAFALSTAATARRAAASSASSDCCDAMLRAASSRERATLAAISVTVAWD